MTQHGHNPGLTRRPTLLALLIGGLVLAGGIALIVITSGSGSKSNGPVRADAAMVTSPAAAPSSSVASSPAPVATLSPATAPASVSTAPKSASTPSPKSTKSSAAPRPAASVKPLTYTVKRGDNLTIIARWFHLHGYGNLYEQNRSVIGNDPDLIFAGEKITISARGMTVSH